MLYDPTVEFVITKFLKAIHDDVAELFDNAS